MSSFNSTLGLTISPTDLSVKNRESTHREFKQDYVKADLPYYLKEIAALANTDGGELIFGITDKPRTVTGVATSSLPNPEDLQNQLAKHLEPAVRFDIDTAEIAGLTLLRIQIFESAAKPVICKKTVTRSRNRNGTTYEDVVLSEGDIYYRYNASSRRASFPELNEMILQRERRELKSFIENLELLQSIGPTRVGMMDLTSLPEDGTSTQVYVTNEAAQGLNIIREGQLVQTDGAPAYRITGDVTLQHGIEVPIPEHDRIPPKDAVHKLSSQVRAVLESDPRWAKGKKLAPIHIKAIAERLGVRGANYKDNDQNDGRFAFFDSTVGRFLYRAKFIDRVSQACESDPDLVISAVLDNE
jgi:hypothetical protein